MPKLKKYQKKFPFSYSFGIYPTLDLLNYRKESVLKVLLRDEVSDSRGVKEVIEICKREGIPFEVNRRLIEKISVKENTYVVGIFEKYTDALEIGKNHMVLVEPRNMGNVGTIIRTMLGFGFKNLVFVGDSVDIFDPKVVRSTMGAIFRIKFNYFDTIEQYLDQYPENSVYVFMLNGAVSIKEVKFQEPMSLIHGNESKGLPNKFKEFGQSVYIPHSKEIDSLNLSVASGISMWESCKMR